MDGSAGTVGRIMAALLGRARRATTPTSAGSASRSSSRTSSATSARTARLDRIYLPAEDRARFGVSEADLRAARPPRRSARCSPTRSSAPARLFAAARPAIAAAPASVRPGVRFATGLYGRMLDRVEATGFDVLGRKLGVRVWHIPGAALEALAVTQRATLRGGRAHAAATSAPTC